MSPQDAAEKAYHVCALSQQAMPSLQAGGLCAVTAHHITLWHYEAEVAQQSPKQRPAHPPGEPFHKRPA
jgi:hypothetical protein